MKKFLLALILILSQLPLSGADLPAPKREFRGAWLHIIGQTQWMNMTPAKARAYIDDQLNRLQEAGCNAVIFQVRPSADAFYISDLEPWTSWAAGKRGKAPDPVWDPMEYTIKEAHRRGMEFHAWLNPYRVVSNPKEVLPASHDVNKHPERYVKFNGQTFFDPAYQENRDFICKVVGDILDRYDVDAIHIDDYFYPYPANGKRFNEDNASYARFGNGMERHAWRRHNVDLLIEQLHKTIKGKKPWVRFGVSPFGIWRNRKNDPRGSESSGLQNYDDLYADVLLWADKGWVDYLAPQLYWSLDMTAAPSRKLARWWNDNVPKNVDLYIGQDIQRTMNSADPKAGDSNELATKIRISRELPNVKGNVWRHGYWLTGNYKGVADSLTNRHQATLAIPPAYGDRRVLPAAPRGLRRELRDGVQYLVWDNPLLDPRNPKAEDPVRYVVYEFYPDEEIDIENPEAIVAVTPFTSMMIGDSEAAPPAGTVYVVTSLDRQNRESRPTRL